MNPTPVYMSRSNHHDSMPQFEDQPCWNCKKPKEVIRILKHWDDPKMTKQYEVLMWCVNDGCSWGHKTPRPCKTHMSLNAIDDKPTKPNLLTTTTNVVVSKTPNLLGMIQ